MRSPAPTEHNLRLSGIVTQLLVTPGQQVEAKDLLLVIEGLA